MRTQVKKKKQVKSNLSGHYEEKSCDTGNRQSYNSSFQMHENERHYKLKTKYLKNQEKKNQIPSLNSVVN